MKHAHSLAGLLLLMVIHSSRQASDPHADTSDKSVSGEGLQLSNTKRHSEGTFSNDYSKYLETRRAQDFVQWLKNSKRNGSLFRRHADGTYTSDMSYYLRDRAARDFVTLLMTGRGRPQ
uniref:glucagon b n=1 Tax=Doryrhamphus excisus TaxID=161450 RepID=UPI0025ADBD25|nr:glucagon b [Doryrhamphus excisus]